MVNASEDKHVIRSNHMENINSEKYSRGRRGAPAKGVGRVTGARVQIPPSPSKEKAAFPPVIQGGECSFFKYTAVVLIVSLRHDFFQYPD